MSSLIQNYNYDIFISYRQKDNKYDGWVTEFVDNLKKELEATFKEEVSVYFDINPHDGLLETHDVDASLKDKLKCLVFIPIISRTYCDPKSFAWEHEFKTFIELASQDKFGLKIKLPNGNVANRVLPIQIHDLNSDDKVLVEKELGGFLRAIEFIYKEPGVNRPLKPDDDDKINLTKTKYRNQINKAANAIDEIINNLKNFQSTPPKETTQKLETSEEIKIGEKWEKKKVPVKFNKRKLLSGVVIAVILIIIIVISYPKIFKRNTLEKLRSSGERISVAVMPFRNMTNDTTWNGQEGIQNELTTYLTNSDELKVRQVESITGLLQSKGLNNYASITPSVASNISQKLYADISIIGTIKHAGTTIRVNAQLIDSKSEEVFKSFQIEDTYKEERIFKLVDSLSGEIKNFLILSKLKQEQSHEVQTTISTNSPEAYRYFLQGRKAFNKENYSAARNFFRQALAIDSNFAVAIIYISTSYWNQGSYDQSKKWCLKAYEKKEQMPNIQKLYTNWLFANNFETPHEEIIYLREILDIDDQLQMPYFLLGNAYNDLYQYDKAIPEYEEALAINKKLVMKPSWVYSYSDLGKAYHKTGKYDKEKILYRKAEMDFPNDPILIYRLAILALYENKTKDANNYIEKFISAQKENSVSEAFIMDGVAGIYDDAGILDKAAECYRKALAMEPEDPIRMNNLAMFLIDKNKNVSEGLELVGKALEISPDNYDYIDTKGWGLYKQGKYQEALDVLQKSWDLRMKNAIYDHESFLHLQEAKKAIADQPKNLSQK